MTRLDEADKQCNELRNKLDNLKSQGRDKNDDIEYMQTLYALRDATRNRLNIPLEVK